MKTLAKAISILCLLCFFEFTPKQAPAQVSFQVFYDGLSPYGNWVNYPPYGYVWIPSSYGFIPYYTGGHWIYTDDYGWIWVSDYDWGWAPFHYGWWEDDPAYGWLWIPGEVWGPAWVSWTYCNGYYGWAPLGYRMTAGYSNIPANRWVFVGERHIADPQVSRYYAPRSQNATYLRTATVIKSSHGPARAAVEKSIGHPITPVAVASNAHPGQSLKGRSLSIYRPSVSKTTSAQPHPAPAKVSDIKSISHHSTTTHKATTTVHTTNGKTNSVHSSAPTSKPANSHTNTTSSTNHQTTQPVPKKAAPQHTTHAPVVHHVHPPATKPVQMQAPRPAPAVQHEGGAAPHEERK